MAPLTVAEIASAWPHTSLVRHAGRSEMTVDGLSPVFQGRHRAVGPGTAYPSRRPVITRIKDGNYECLVKSSRRLASTS